MREVQLGHVVGALLIGGPQRENEINGVHLPGLRRFLLCVFLPFALLLFGVLVLMGRLIALQRINSGFARIFRLSLLLLRDRLNHFRIRVLLVARPLDNFMLFFVLCGSYYGLNFHLFLRINRFLVWCLRVGISHLIIFRFGRF